MYYPNFLNRYSSRLGDTATIRVTLEENIKYPMWGAGYALRPQYSADLIHEAAIGKIAGEQLIKLMTLGLTEKQAEEEIVSGFLR